MFDPPALDLFFQDKSALPFRFEPGAHPTPRLARAREALRRQGDASTSAFMVFSGLLHVQADEPDSGSGWRGAGAWIGVVEALAGGPSPVSVVAWRDSVIFEFSPEALRAAIAANPAALAGFAAENAGSDVARLQARPKPFVLGIIPVAEDAALRDLVRAQIDPDEFVLIESGDDAIETCEAVARREARIDGTQCSVWLGDGAPGAWTDTILRAADRIAFVTPARMPPGEQQVGWIVAALAQARRSDVLRIGARETGAAVDAFDWRGANVYDMRFNAADIRDYLDNFISEHGHPERLKRFQLFSGLDAPSLALLQEYLQWRTVAGGERLITRGDPADGLYVLDVGRLEVSITPEDGKRISLDVLTPGVTVGEFALVDGVGKRTADVDAVRDCHVGFLSKESFDALFRIIPQIGLNLARRLTNRIAAQTSGEARPSPTLLAVLGLEPGREVDAFMSALLATFQTVLGRKVRLVSSAMVESEVGAGMSTIGIGQPGFGHLIAWLQSVESDHDVTLLACGANEDKWATFCAQQADRIVLAAPSAATAEMGAVEKVIADHERKAGRSCELVLLHDAGRYPPSGTSRWLAERPATYVHHVRIGSTADIASAARRIMGCAFGLAFSGGVGFAPAHLGVIRAMKELGLPLDVVAGTSSGAGIAGTMAMGMSYDEALEAAFSVVERLGMGWSEFQPPFTSLTNGSRFDRIVRMVAGDRMIEDQPIPCTFSAVDIANNQVVWMDRGLMWTAIRASGSMPIIVPPVSIGGRVMVDGAVAVHNPIQPLLPRCERGMLIVSELAGPPRSYLAGMPSYGTQLSGWKQLADHILPWRKPQETPTIADVIVRSMTLSNELPGGDSERLQRHRAVCHVRSSMAGSSPLNVARPLAKRLEERTYNEARARLTEWLEAAPFPVRR